MMFGIIANTIDGVLQAGINTVKIPVGVVVSPLDDGKTLEDSVDGLIEGLERIGDEASSDK